MPIGAQPRGHKGTSDQPYSALNLRLVLALFGVVSCAVLGILLWRLHFTVAALIILAMGVGAAVDAVVVQLRRRARRRTDPTDHSLFE